MAIEGWCVMRNRVAVAVILAHASLAALLAQDATPSVEEILDRMGAYLEAYESQLTAITADERYEQQHQRLAMRSTSMGRGLEAPRVRQLESEVAFVRLPGSGEWAGFRDVRRVDRRRIGGAGTRLTELMAQGSTAFDQAIAITAASSKHNLGSARTTNMPTVPLEVIHPRHRHRFTHRFDGVESVRGVKTHRLIFEEVARPGLIQNPTGGDVRSYAVAWIDGSSGTVWRAEVVFREWDARPTSSDTRIRVEFAIDARLQTMVPTEMRETFYVPGGRGSGKATYRNFKRFETGGRIVP
jgi:hypothetical protein